MNTNTLRKVRAVIAVIGALGVAGQYRAGFLLPSFSVSAQEAQQGTETRQFIQDDINRRRNNTRTITEPKRSETEREAVQRGEAVRRGPIDRLRNLLGDRKAPTPKEQTAQVEQRITRLAQKIDEINRKHTGQAFRILERIESVFQKLPERIERATQKGIDMTEVNIRMNSARESIDLARKFIVSQSETIYPINLVEGENPAVAMRAVRETFRANIANMRNMTKQARSAVIEVIKALDVAKEANQ